MKDTIQKLNQSKVPIVKIDDSLGKYKNSNVFREKTEEANKTLNSTILPEQLIANVKS